MKAQQMMETVATAENDLCNEVWATISKYINAISKDTGLNVSGINFSINEITSVDSPAKEWVVSGCRIDVDLPDRIYTGHGS